MNGDIDIPRAWERQPGETTPQWQAFRCYVEMGADRSLAKVGKSLGRSVSLIEQWSSKNDWRIRVRSYEAWMEQQRIQGDAEASRAQGKSLAERRDLVAESLITQVEKMRDQLTEAMSRPLKGDELTLAELDRVLGMWERFVAVAGPLIGIVTSQGQGDGRQPAANLNLFDRGEGTPSLNPDRMTRAEVDTEILDRIIDAGMRSVMGDEQSALPEHEDDEE